MKAVVVIIGDEILNGTTLDTNSQYIARALEGFNIPIIQRLTIKDERQAILDALKDSLSIADLVITTGGLGPTKDDITKKTIAEFFNDTLVENEDVLRHVESYFKNKKRPILDVNRLQAMVPTKCEVLHNAMGTAPGMWVEENGKVVVSMPGVPYEMRYLVDNGILPKLKAKTQGLTITNKYIHTIGVGESSIAKQLEDLEDALPEHIKMAYLPSPGIVKLRLTGTGLNASELDVEMTKHQMAMSDRLGQIVFGYKNDTISSVVGELLLQKGKNIGTVESCSSGYMAQLITQTPGSSAYFEGSLVTYSYRLKEEFLKVEHSTLEKHGAVSQETIEEMAKGGLSKLGTDYAIATSGIAGPGGGLQHKPVGTVWIAVADKDKVVSKQYRFGSDRTRNIHLTAVMGLEMLRRFILQYPIKSE